MACTALGALDAVLAHRPLDLAARHLPAARSRACHIRR
jgi:hypothetical protein